MKYSFVEWCNELRDFLWRFDSSKWHYSLYRDKSAFRCLWSRARSWSWRRFSREIRNQFRYSWMSQSWIRRWECTLSNESLTLRIWIEKSTISSCRCFDVDACAVDYSRKTWFCIFCIWKFESESRSLLRLRRLDSANCNNLDLSSIHDNNSSLLKCSSFRFLVRLLRLRMFVLFLCNSSNIYCSCINSCS
jgi:hypothetical protein